MSHVNAYDGPRDHIGGDNTQADAELEAIADAPPPLPQGHDVFVPNGLLDRIRLSLHRWAARYADAPHARQRVKETRLLIEEIDALPRHCKD